MNMLAGSLNKSRKFSTPVRFLYSESNILLRPYSSKTGAKFDAQSKKLLQLLRKETGYPLINCRQALQVANYDLEKAKAHLMEIAKQKGLDKLQSNRSMQQGLISLATSENSAVLVEVNCETDFVAKTPQFQKIVKSAGELILKSFGGKTEEPKIEIPVEDILKLEVVGYKEETINDLIVMAAGKLRENIQVRRAVLMTSGSPKEFIGGYVHPSGLVQSTRPTPLGSYAAVCKFEIDPEADYGDMGKTTLKLIGRDISQHIVGMNPAKVGKVPKTRKVKINVETVNDAGELVVTKQQVDRRPPVDGSRELMKQAFLLDSDYSVAEWVSKRGLRVTDFVRFRVAEKLEE